MLFRSGTWTRPRQPPGASSEPSTTGSGTGERVHGRSWSMPANRQRPGSSDRARQPALKTPFPHRVAESISTSARAKGRRLLDPCGEQPPSNMPGGVLLSHAVPRAVPSAQKGLTSGFGMGPGVSPSLWPPKRYGVISQALGHYWPGSRPYLGNRIVDANIRTNKV